MQFDSKFSWKCQLTNSMNLFKVSTKGCHWNIVAWWRHMTTKISVNIGSGNGLLSGGITWTDVDFSFVVFFGFQLRTTSERVPRLLFGVMSYVKLILLK